jgi:DNA-binding XRE family transcriptional regulator
MDYVGTIKQLLAMSGMTQKELGVRVGLKAAAMHRILSGKQEPKLKEAYEIARQLGVTLNDLVEDGLTSGHPAGRLIRVSEEDYCVIRVAQVLGADAALKRLVNAPGEPAGVEAATVLNH